MVNVRIGRRPRLRLVGVRGDVLTSRQDRREWPRTGDLLRTVGTSASQGSWLLGALGRLGAYIGWLGDYTRYIGRTGPQAAQASSPARGLQAPAESEPHDPTSGSPATARFVTVEQLLT